MHTQALFAVHERPALHALMRSYPLATLFCPTPGGAEAHLLPLALCETVGDGCLQGHVARTHGLWTDTAPGSNILVVFQSPNAYISPRWYVNGQRSGRLAPSWNYAAVQARGKIRFVDDPAWLLAHLATLTAAQERERPDPWSLADAAPAFVQQAAQRLVGFEIEILDLTGKRFLSQQRTPADRCSVVAHLSHAASGAARELAGLIPP